MFASLNGAIRSFWIRIASALCTLSDVGPSKFIGCPKATTLSPQRSVVVPTPAAMTSP
jgi:hypothetical protein